MGLLRGAKMAKTTRCVALLRGVNIGRAKRLQMADLRAVVERLGYSEVRTLLNSGNVVFSASGSKLNTSRAASSIEESLAAQTGVASRVTVLTAAELAAVVSENSLLDIASDPKRLLVAVLNDGAHRELLQPLLAQSWHPEALAAGGRAAYLWCAGGILESGLATALGRVLRDNVTSRNWSTMLKLHALAKE
jgi:uncharacterized protein (DUF1697 family)